MRGCDPSATSGLLLAVLLYAAASCANFSSGSSSGSPGANDASAANDASNEASTPPGEGGPPATPDGGEPDDAGDDRLDGGTRLFAFVTINSFVDVKTAAEADTKCMGEAAGRLPGKFIAWFPNGTTTAIQRLVSPTGQPLSGPWFRPDRKRIVAGRSALASTAMVPLENPIAIDAAGKDVGASAVWTGTFADGTNGNVCPSSDPTKGTANATDSKWTNQTAFVATCNSSLHLYCFQIE